MIELIYFAIFYVLCCFIVIWRLIKGPTAPDRVTAGDCVEPGKVYHAIYDGASAALKAWKLFNNEEN